MKHDPEVAEFMRQLGNRLAIARRLSRLSQSQVADKLQKNQTSYGSYERGTAMPDIITVRKLSIILNVNEAWLLGLPEGEGKGPVI